MPFPLFYLVQNPRHWDHHNRFPTEQDRKDTIIGYRKVIIGEIATGYISLINNIPLQNKQTFNWQKTTSPI